MAVTTLYDARQRRSVMWCNTDNRAFGPVFDDHEAADFLDWMRRRPGVPNVRDMSDSALAIWLNAWKQQVAERLDSFAGPSDRELYGAGA